MELKADSLAVRGGSNRDVDSLAAKIQEASDDGDGPLLSIFCGTPVRGEVLHDTLHRVCLEAGLPHPKVQVARTSDLIEAGLALEWDTSDGQASNHFNARFRLPVEDSQVHDFISCFDEPTLNPTGGRKGRTR